jgi:acyl carrier protein
MNREQVLERLTGVLREVFDDDHLVAHPDLTAHEVAEWDSVNHIRLIVSVEKAFRIKFKFSEATGFANIGEMAEAVVAHLAGRVP